MSSFPMKTGFTNLIEPEKPDEEFISRVNALLLTLLEKAFINAGFYAKEANRNTITPMDIKISLMYEAHEFWNHEDLDEKVEEYQNMSESDSDSESNCSDIIEDNDTEFTRANTNNETILLMNNYFDNWNSWNPTDPIIIALKYAIDSKFDIVL